MAIAGVLAYHAAPAVAPGGYLGVEVFFVLSGYLLASRLLDEHRRLGNIDWARYASQRARRLAPALAVFLVGVVVLGAVAARSDAHRLRGDLVWSVLGLTNWHLISDGASYFGHLGRPPMVRHLWSLAVEIQFYAVIPLIVAMLLWRSRRQAVGALCAGIALSTLVMALLYRTGDASRAYYGTDARIGALLAGMVLAVVLVPGEEGGQRRWLAAPGAVGGLAVAGLAALFLLAGEGSRPAFVATFVLCRLATVVVIAALVGRGWLPAALSSPVPRWLGQRSYSIYLWHWPLIVLLRPGIDVAWPPVIASAVAVGGGIVLGHLSFQLVEKPFLGGSRPPHETPGRRSVLTGLGWTNASVAAIATVMILLGLPTVDPVAQNLEVGQQVLASQAAPAPAPPEVTVTSATAPPAPTPAPAPTVAVSPAVEPQPVPPPPPGPEPGTVTVTAIGDSVMLSAVVPLQERLGAGSYIDAKLRRQFAQGVDLARQLREEGRLGQVVIVHLGTNGPPKASEVDALMRELTGVAEVRLVTVRMPQRWEAATNQTLHDAAARHPSIQIVDWYGYSEGHLEWFESDGTHMKRSGARAYAELLASPGAAAGRAPASVNRRSRSPALVTPLSP